LRGLSGARLCCSRGEVRRRADRDARISRSRIYQLLTTYPTGSYGPLNTYRYDRPRVAPGRCSRPDRHRPTLPRTRRRRPRLQAPTTAHHLRVETPIALTGGHRLSHPRTPRPDQPSAAQGDRAAPSCASRRLCQSRLAAPRTNPRSSWCPTPLRHRKGRRGCTARLRPGWWVNPCTVTRNSASLR